MSDVEIEALTPWLESGELGTILLAASRWYDATDSQTQMRINILPWDVHARPDLDLRPVVALDLTYGAKGYAGQALVTAWRGADPATVAPALARALVACRAANRERKAHGTLTAIPAERIELAPAPPDPAAAGGG